MTERKKGVYKVGISGSYGGFNVGDEAILHVMIREITGLIKRASMSRR